MTATVRRHSLARGSESSVHAHAGSVNILPADAATCPCCRPAPVRAGLGRSRTRLAPTAAVDHGADVDRFSAGKSKSQMFHAKRQLFHRSHTTTYRKIDPPRSRKVSRVRLVRLLLPKSGRRSELGG